MFQTCETKWNKSTCTEKKIEEKMRNDTSENRSKTKGKHIY